MFFQKEIETLQRSKLEQLQLERLKKIVAYCYDNVPFYTKKFDSVGLKPSHITSFKEFRNLPPTTKDDFRDNYPYGLLAVPMQKIVRLHASSGTTGKPVVVCYTKGDLDIWSDAVARFIVSSGGRSSDIVQNAFGYGLFTGALGLHTGWEKIGAAVIPASAGNTERQIMLMRDLKVTALVATPSYGLYIGETMREIGVKPSDLSLRLGFFGAEASTKETHAQLSALLGIRTNDNYGLTEVMGPGVAGECELKCGMHIAEDHFYAEIVDGETLKPLPDGDEGEMLITTLTKEGMPVLRYRTKDITRLNRDPCACGRTHARMNRVVGRTDDMLIIRGVNVFPSQIESVLMEMDGVGNSYEIIVDRVKHADTLEVLIEITDGSLLNEYAALEALRSKIRRRLREVLQLDVKVRLVEPMSIKRYEGKAKRVRDLRKDAGK
ncbi:MAG: phenylacetate--CoA ligase [Clostridiales bacterium]|jgi:phenylacetate-CoA ligase|nr:phenylacetate--CoA ligase [Clostridiales bacterium]